MTLIRRLYGRPLDTLLATWGVSLIMQQAARSIFGPIGDEVTAPSWLAGSLGVSSGLFRGFGLPLVRLIIIALSAAVLALITFLIARTRVGLLVQAVHQDRDMAEALGINTRTVDLAVFAIGSVSTPLLAARTARDRHSRRCMASQSFCRRTSSQTCGVPCEWRAREVLRAGASELTPVSPAGKAGDRTRPEPPREIPSS